MDVLKLQTDEVPTSLAFAKLEGSQEPLMFVGSVKGPSRVESDEGRILTFSIADRKLILLSEHAVSGAVFTLQELGGRLIATINGKVHRNHRLTELGNCI